MAASSLTLDILLNTKLDSASLKSSIGSIGGAVNDLQSSLNKVNTKAMASGFNEAVDSAQASITLQKQALAGLIAAGQGSSETAKKIRASLAESTGEANKLNSAMQQVEKEFGNAQQKAQGLGGAFQFNQITQASQTIAGTLDTFSKPFVALDSATAQMKTLGAEAAAMAPNLREAAIVMSKDLPFAASELQTTMFDALASGVKGGEAGLRAFAETSAKLATGGGAAIADSTKLLAGNLNAYGKSAEEAGKFSDIFFNTVNYGVVSVPELSHGLANVVPTAAAAGIELEGVGAAIATMTSKGIPGIQSTTKLNALLIELQKPGAALAPILKQAGVSLESLRNDDLPVTLEKVNKALKETGQTATTAFSSSEASAAFNVLAGDMEGFAKTFADVRDTTGSTDFAFTQMTDSIDVQLKQLLSTTQAYIIDGVGALGNGFVFAAGAATQLTPAIAGIAGLKQIVPDGTVDNIKGFASSIIEKVIPALGFQSAATIEAAAASHAMAIADAESAVAAEAAALIQAESAVEQSLAAQAQAAAALEIVTLKEAELAAIVQIGGADATAATEALLSAELKAGAALEVAAAKQAEAAASVEVATGLGVEVVAAQASVVATGEAAIAADASAFSFGAMWAAATGPVALVIAGVVAVGAAVYLLYTYVQPVHDLFNAIGDIAVVVFDGLWTTVKEVGAALFSVGEILFNLWITPFKILYGVVQPIISSLFSMIGGLFNFGSAAGSTTTVIQKVQAAFEVLHLAIGFVQASLEGIIAGISVFAETATNVITSILNLDFAGAVDAAKTGGEKMGNAVTAGFNEKLGEIKSSDAAKKFEKDFESAKKGVDETLKSGLEIQAKIKAVDNIAELEKSLEDAQAKLKPLELKVKSGGTLTDEEKKSFDELSKSVSTVTGKIKEIAPEAVTGQKSVVSSNGQLIQSYEINLSKLGEIAVKQKAAYGAESQKEQLKYSANVVNLSTLYDQQKTRLAEVKKALDEANEKGDTKGAEKLKQEFKELSESANKTGKQMSDSFEQGAKAGLLTNDAIVTVGKSLGKSAEDSQKLADGIAKSADNAAKAILNTQELGKQFDALKKKASENEAQASLGAQGTAQAFKQLEIDIRAARKLTNEQKKSMTAEEQRKAIEAAEAVALATFNASSKSSVKSFDEAKALSKKTIAEQIKIQKDERQKERELDAIASKADVGRQLADREKLQKTALDKSLETIEQNRKNEENNVRTGAEFATKTETEKAIEIIDINQKYNVLKLKKQIEYENAIFGIKKDGVTSEIDLAQNRDNAITKLNNQIQNSEREAIQKKQEEIGKGLLKSHEQELKLNEDALKRNLESTKTSIDAIDKRKVESSNEELTRLDELNAAKINQIVAQGKLEINELLGKNEGVFKAEESLKAALAKGDKDLITRAENNKTEAIRIAQEKDAAILASHQRTNDAIDAQDKAAIEAKVKFERSLKEQTAETIRDDELDAIQITLDKELAAARGNERLKTDATVKAAIARNEAEEKYLKSTSTAYKIAVDFQTNLLNSFTDEAIAARKKQLKEDQKSYNDSKESLFQSLKARTLDERGYYAARNDLQEKAEKLQENSTSFLKQAHKALIESLGATAVDSQSKVAASIKRLNELNKAHGRNAEEEAKLEKKRVEAKDKLYEELTSNMAVSFISMVASGEEAGSAALKIALQAGADFLSAMVPVWVASIFGVNASTGPLGLALAAAATGVLLGLVQLAKASLSGAHDGFIGITSAGTGRRPSSEDTIPIMVRPNESIINPNATAINYGMLEFINKTNRPGHEYYAKMGYDSPEIKMLVMPHVVQETKTILIEKEKLSLEVHTLREIFERDSAQYRENMDAIRKQMISVSVYKDEVNNSREVISELRNIAVTVTKENASLRSQLRVIDRENQLRAKKGLKESKTTRKKSTVKTSNWI